jgi:hypothetical protein
MDVWVAEDEVMESIKELIANYHPDLVAVEKQIAVVFREKASKVGDGVILAKSRKAPSLLGVLGDTDYKFVIEIAADEWKSLNNKQRLALLDHHLCACRTEEDQASGEIKKCWVQPPDVAFYQDEVERHGFWRSGKTNKPPEPTLIEEIFGD